MKRPILLLFVLATLASTASSQEFAQWLFPFPSTTSRQFPRITKGADGSMVVTYVERQGNNAKVFVVLSADNGRTWTNPTSPTSVLYGSIGLQRQPYTVIGGDGTLHCVWENFWKGNQLSIFHSRSTDQGSTWSTPAPLHEVSDGRNQDFSSVAAGSDGLVYACFISGDIDDNDGYRHLFLVRSSNGGETWGTPVRVDQFTTEGGSCECCQPHVMVARDGMVGVGFRANLNNKRDVYLATSTDSGQSFIAPYILQTGTWTIAGCPSTGPKLRFDDNGTVHAVWRDTRDDVGEARTYYTRYHPGTRAIPRNIDLTAPIASGSEYADVAVSGQGDSVCVIIETTRGVQILRSDDGGNSFKSEIVDPFAVQSVSGHVVWTNEGKPYAAWQSTRDSHYDIRVSVDQVTDVSEEARTAQSVYATRSSNGWELTGAVETGAQGNVDIYDVRGSVVLKGTLIGDENPVLTVHGSIPRQPLWARIGQNVVFLP